MSASPKEICKETDWQWVEGYVLTFSDSTTAVARYDNDAAKNFHFEDILQSCMRKYNFSAKFREEVAQIKLKITIKQLPRHYPIPLGQIVFKVNFPLYTAERNTVFINVELLFWLNRTHGDEELCNGLRRHSHMISFKSLALTFSVGS